MIRHNESVRLTLDPCASRPSAGPYVSPQLERAIATRWQVWVPWVWIYLRRRGIAPGGSTELAWLRQRHSDHIVTLTDAGVSMRLIRRHRLDDPRITDDVRAALVRSARERQRKAWPAGRHLRDEMAHHWGNGIRNRALSIESPQSPSPNPRNIPPSPEGAITIASITKHVSKHFYLAELCDADLKRRSHRRVFVLPRQVAIYIVRQVIGASLQEIGRQFGGRHHTTVLHSIKKIEAMRRSDEALNRTITRLMDAVVAQS